jgi:hypothetical protein
LVVWGLDGGKPEDIVEMAVNRHRAAKRMFSSIGLDTGFAGGGE